MSGILFHLHGVVVIQWSEDECPILNTERDEVRNDMMGRQAPPLDTCRDEWLPVLAFVPLQDLGQVYEPECGFPRGTIFPALDKPFLAGGCAR